MNNKYCSSLFYFSRQIQNNNEKIILLTKRLYLGGIYEDYLPPTYITYHTYNIFEILRESQCALKKLFSHFHGFVITWWWSLCVWCDGHRAVYYNYIYSRYLTPQTLLTGQHLPNIFLLLISVVLMWLILLISLVEIIENEQDNNDHCQTEYYQFHFTVYTQNTVAV